MEVATTNNQNHHHHHAHTHHHHHQNSRNNLQEPQHQNHQETVNNLGSSNSTLVSGIGGGGSRSPFQREVREWQRIDPDTGALLSGRLEADRWINGPMNSYGKISDSQNIAQPNGTHHTQRKQLEVLQARTANGAMQVIRTHTVQTTSSSSSRWSSTSTSMTNTSPLNIFDSSRIKSHFHNNNHNTNTNTNTITNSNSNITTNNTTANNQTNSSPFWIPTTTTTKSNSSSQLSSTVDICEVNENNEIVNHDNNNVGNVGDNLLVTELDIVDEEDVNDNDYYDDDDDDRHENLMINSSGSSINTNTNTSTSNSINNSNNNSSSSFHNLLLDTAPSLKLSNLMKSSSSISSQSSNNSTSAATMNTHRKAAKISLHAIVGNNKGNSDKSAAAAASSSSASSLSVSAAKLTTEDRTATSSTSSVTTAKQAAASWHKRLSEQPDLYGNSNNKLKQSRVGVHSSFASAVGTGTGTDHDGDDDDDGGGGGVGGVTPTQLNRQTRRRDLESFRHYNEHTKSSSSSTFDADNVDDDDDHGNNDDDDDLRLTARHQRRQQVPQYTPSVQLQRSRSISTDDLSNDWDRNELGENSGEEPSDWRRVSKLRRSFQSQIKANEYNRSPTTTASSSANSTPTTPRRPIDLPSSSVSVSRIRAELENGRRLNTAMRNNHVDLAALDTILNAPVTEKSAPTKRTSFLTAESLKEIRGKLKKLSDESLYKEDFLAYQALDHTPEIEEEHIEVQLVKPLDELASPTLERSAFQSVRRRDNIRVATTVFGREEQDNSQPESHKTHSLESRQKYRDTNSSEWHLRRKSYGFEKMSPPEDRSIFRVDASTDSGLGRSGEQLGNWSPTEAPSSARGTIIHFGEPSKQVGYQQHQLKTSESPNSSSELNKRHSIAVEESQYIRKASQVHVNGVNRSGNAVEPMGDSTSTIRNTQQKRVEFCKTEVHFAAESGRVNIVETDGKPPPTNNFRRRRRTSSGPLQSLVKSATTISSTSTTNSTVALSPTLFGDNQRRKTLASTTVAYKATLMDPPEVIEQATQVTVTTPKPLESYSLTESTSRNSYTSTSGIDTTDNETDDISAIRGILKNKPIKPKPYHLGDNIDSADALWGVQLKSVSMDRQLANKEDSSVNSIKSVAERVRIVEKRQIDSEIQHTNGYSTKINLSLGDQDWPETGNSEPTVARRPSAQELLLQDLREHQRMIDEGLRSTSLIIKTMRSANAFDEAMRRLSNASIESTIMQPTIVVPTPMLRSNSYQESTSSRRSSNGTITSADLFGSTLNDSLPRRNSSDSFIPLVPPRLKLLNNTEIPVSQQLTQLRRMYDSAQEEVDSADEEVKHYFTRGEASHYENSDSGGGTQDTSSSLEDISSELEISNSWSRIKSKRTVLEVDDEHMDHLLKPTDLPRSNVMSIALHSPKSEQPQQEEQRNSPQLRASQLVPVAKPRMSLKDVQTAKKPEVHVATTVKATSEPLSDTDSLKIVKEARGARKLRDHELSYFGVQVSKNEISVESPKSNPYQSSRRSLPSRKLSNQEKKTHQTTTKWQLLNDRPDLLRHSPIEVEPPVAPRNPEIKTSLTESLQQKSNDDDSEDFDEHFYENIAHELMPSFRVKSPSPNLYDRKTDVQRDVQILSEMTRNADQTLKAISDEAAFKDQRRRSSLRRRNSKPLETIDEKSLTSDKTSETSNVARGTFASEARRNSRQSTPSPTQGRSSSQSSIECCPRARSRSLSSEREYENVKPRRSATQAQKTTTAQSRRSSSRDSMTHCSSGDEQIKRDGRLRTRNPKRVSSSGNSQSQTREKQRNHSTHGSLEKHNHSREEPFKQRSSSMRERERKSTSDRPHSASRHTRSTHKDGENVTVTERHHSSRATNSSTAQHSTGRVRSHSNDRHGISSSSRLMRSSRGHDPDAKGHHHHRSSTHKTDRIEKDNDKLSRSRGHSSRSKHGERERKPTVPITTNTSATATTHSLKKATTKSSSLTQSASKRSSKSGTRQASNENELTYDKNAQILNGHGHGQHNSHPQQIIQHSLATTTIAAKQRERHGKDRK